MKLAQIHHKLTKDKWKNSDYREKVISGLAGLKRSRAFKDKQSARIKEWYEKNPKQLAIRSKRMKEMWKNGTIVKRNFSCNESKMERDFYNEYAKPLFQLEQKTNTVRIEKRWYYPDICAPDYFGEGRGLIIEFFGDFWHANPKFYKDDDIIFNNTKAKDIWARDKKRKEELESAGYIVIIVWQDNWLNYKKRKQDAAMPKQVVCVKR